MTWLWNLRFRLAHLILPGVHKHIRALPAGEPCDREECKS
jgi:hypothetical protein